MLRDVFSAPPRLPGALSCDATLSAAMLATRCTPLAPSPSAAVAALSALSAAAAACSRSRSCRSSHSTARRSSRTIRSLSACMRTTPSVRTPRVSLAPRTHPGDAARSGQIAYAWLLAARPCAEMRAMACAPRKQQVGGGWARSAHAHAYLCSSSSGNTPCRLQASSERGLDTTASLGALTSMSSTVTTPGAAGRGPAVSVVAAIGRKGEAARGSPITRTAHARGMRRRGSLARARHATRNGISARSGMGSKFAGWWLRMGNKKKKKKCMVAIPSSLASPLRTLLRIVGSGCRQLWLCRGCPCALLLAHASLRGRQHRPRPCLVCATCVRLVRASPLEECNKEPIRPVLQRHATNHARCLLPRQALHTLRAPRQQQPGSAPAVRFACSPALDAASREGRARAETASSRAVAVAAAATRAPPPPRSPAAPTHGQHVLPAPCRATARTPARARSTCCTTHDGCSGSPWHAAPRATGTATS